MSLRHIALANKARGMMELGLVTVCYSSYLQRFPSGTGGKSNRVRTTGEPVSPG